MDAIELSIFASRIEAICEEMGAVLRRAAFSPNIKDRLDYSCAVFDGEGGLCAQAAHIPVHLGSMAFTMSELAAMMDWKVGDTVVVNDPFLGGTHLPDVTVISPVFVGDERLGFVVNRAHHADIGADSPGSMPISRSLEEEGLVIPPTTLVRGGVLDQKVMDAIIAATSNAQVTGGDFAAQLSANQTGCERLAVMIKKTGVASYCQGLDEINQYGERLARGALAIIPNGRYQFQDFMDDDGLGSCNIPIKVSVEIKDGNVAVDFSGTAKQTPGNINCPLSVAAAGVYYVFRCFMPPQTPACAGTFRPIFLYAPKGCLLNAERPAAVAAGNVETSSRVVDVVLGALAKAMPDAVPAASQGTMNNLAMGSREQGKEWDYYETMGGGMGAGKHGGGLSAVQTHMTNTRNTPVEVLEMSYPVRVRKYQIRTGSGGSGHNKGGDGLVREFEFLDVAQVTVLSERRQTAPWGLQGGQPGLAGENRLNKKLIQGKVSQAVKKGDCISIATPGGGGWGG